MRNPKFPAFVKTRIAEDTKAALVEIAGERELALSDVAREALREYAERNARRPAAPAATEEIAQ